MMHFLKRLALSIVLASCAIYGSIVGYMAFNQNSFLFEPTIANSKAPVPFPEDIFKRIHLPVDGAILQGIQTITLQKNWPTLVFFAGNAQNLTAFGLFLKNTLKSVNLIGFNYRGFGQSEGAPSTKNIIGDTRPIYNWVKNTPHKTLYSLGLSIGTGPAAQFATYEGVAGLMLAMPYNSLASIGADVYPWLPVEAIFRSNIHTGEIIKNISVPVAIVTAGEDTLIRPIHSKKLANHVVNLIDFSTLKGKTHSTLIGSPAFADWLIKILNRLEAAP